MNSKEGKDADWRREGWRWRREGWRWRREGWRLKKGRMDTGKGKDGKERIKIGRM